MLLGYTHDPSSSRDGELGIGAGDADSTYITMFVTIEPPLQPAEPAKEKVKNNHVSWPSAVVFLLTKQ